MLLYVLLGGCAAAGMALQRLPHAERTRRLLWQANVWLLSPPLVVWAVATLRLGSDVDVRALVAVLLASWCMVLFAGGYARLVARSRSERGALWLGAGFENSAYFGYPASQLLYGHAGLKLAVIYGQTALGLPAIVVTTSIAAVHGRAGARPRLRSLLTSNPLLGAFALGIALHGVPTAAPLLEPVGGTCASVVGPAGFLLFGLSLPLGRLGLAAGTVARALGAMSVRFLAGPLTLAGIALALGARLPGVFLVLIASPTAMHVMTLARVYRVDPELTRLIVVGSSLAGFVLIGTLHAL